KKNPEKTSVLVYFSEEEIDLAVTGLLENWDEALELASAKKPKSLKKLVSDIEKAMKNRTSAPDIALFGRMLAENPALNIDAASQVAHAISTHRVNMDMDFFTAVDDLQSEEETGSSHMGVTAFNSACFYRYARIDFKQLVKNLDGNEDLARKTVVGFLRAALRAIPSGKQNSFAAQNPPSFALAVVREDGMSWSLANAFETPVTPAREGGFVKKSIEAADEYWGKLTKIYGNDSITTCLLNMEDDLTLNHLKGKKENEKEWLNCVLSALTKQEA
ncbi:MAG TPA: type I-E CRISPR-associated protein Cas7/Cse4/CasC, partial [Anaerolineales bacterium]|nr:type I-E CRISPR-associated protein Cas7/Cse4/CasC [Anaerolineales bacterium]